MRFVVISKIECRRFAKIFGDQKGMLARYRFSWAARARPPRPASIVAKRRDEQEASFALAADAAGFATAIPQPVESHTEPYR
jgi:hypothetical protein